MAVPNLSSVITKPKTPFLITETAFCAEGGTRTRTGLLPHAPETCVSTSFTTSARTGRQK
jgi:hypothetical protein